MLDRLIKPQPSKDRTPSYYLKSLLAGYIVSSAYPLDFQPSTKLFYNEKPFTFSDPLVIEGISPELGINRQFGIMVSGTVRFGFYEIFKRILKDIQGDKWAERLRLLNYGIAAAASEFIAASAAFPFTNRSIIDDHIMKVQNTSAPNQTLNPDPHFINELPEQPVKSLRSYYSGLSANLLRYVPCTVITFTTFELVSQILYDYILRAPKEKYNGINQTIFGVACGSVAGSVYYFAQRLLGSALKNVNAHPPRSLGFYATQCSIQFGLYNFIKVLLNSQTLGQGKNSRLAYQY